ncbi:MAG TPA: reverse transcriptase family protein [Planctomycetaceae bacterium]|nr:reverse transcriptase family protein [Planctomycetaceae bacterium]
MMLFNWLRRLFGRFPQSQAAAAAPRHRSERARREHRRVKLVPLRYRPRQHSAESSTVESPAYRFARPSISGGWLDLSHDQNDGRLDRFNLPKFRHPQELAGWLEIPLGQLAWLVHRFDDGERPADERSAHYCYRWIPKRSGGARLIEAPKSKLKGVQRRILAEILSRVPPHPAAHGFIAGRSICSNARPHVGQRVVVKLDLEQFYPTVSFSRVVAIFRSLGYAREAAVWLGRLTTAALPHSLVRQGTGNPDLKPYLGRRLPQGAPTSPALANLSAFPLDLRLSGLARTFGANYTRYADDLTFSGDERFLKSLWVFLPLVDQIVRSERFDLNKSKRKIIRSNQRQTVTGIVVNSRPNMARRDYDALKAVLTNCIRRGPSTQNHSRHPNFAAHLLGRIAHASQLNPKRGQKLHDLYRQIDWNK